MSFSSSSAQQALQSLGRRLREVRLDAGLTGRQLGRLTGWHPSKVSKIETGKQPPSTEDIRLWCRRSNASGQAGELIDSLRAVEGMFIEWRRLERTGLRASNEAEARVWERAKRFRIYSSMLIPGPVQTPAYLNAVLASLRALRNFPDDIDATVQVRMRKQEAIHQRGKTFAIVLEESVLRSRIGDAETMSAQLGHLLQACTLPSISLGIIPLDRDRTPIWTAEAFWMFDNTRVAVELISGHLNITQAQEVALYEQAFERLSDLAVYGAPARALIAEAIAATATRQEMLGPHGSCSSSKAPLPGSATPRARSWQGSD